PLAPVTAMMSPPFRAKETPRRTVFPPRSQAMSWPRKIMVRFYRERPWFSNERARFQRVVHIPITIKGILHATGKRKPRAAGKNKTTVRGKNSGFNCRPSTGDIGPFAWRTFAKGWKRGTSSMLLHYYRNVAAI